MSTEPALYGLDLWGEPIAPPARGKLADEFLVPPFTVLNAREGWWQERKQCWLRLGIKSEVGRGCNVLNLPEGCEEYRRSAGNYNKSAPAGSAMPAANYANRERGSGSGSAISGSSANGATAKSYNIGDWMESEAGGSRGNESGTSIFDPVICELAYRWFCPQSGSVLDPFAGGSVRGIVAALLGRNYTGIELRPEQIASNREQSAALCDGIKPAWIEGDCIDTVRLAGGAKHDFLFSCPPYGDLERYSDDSRDLSTMAFPEFAVKYRACIAAACAMLKENRFACFVVGDFRDKRGHYRDFVSLTIAGFREAGMPLYNEAILVTCVGSLPVRVTKQFEVSRKLGKTHQNILVFVKGDPRVAANDCS